LTPPSCRSRMGVCDEQCTLFCPWPRGGLVIHAKSIR
jgi:hypothetical protein